MKRLHFLVGLTILIITGFTISASAQNSQKNVEKIIINKKGEIYDHGWNKLGFIDKDNIVRNREGQKIYFIDKNGNVIDANGKNLGKAQKNGNYYNINGENIIQVRDKNSEMCEILDPKGHNMGTVHKNYKLHACAAHCLFLQRKNEKAQQTDIKELKH
jgi:hypothetical protein